jgi:hypothetical protein
MDTSNHVLPSMQETAANALEKKPKSVATAARQDDPRCHGEENGETQQAQDERDGVLVRQHLLARAPQVRDREPL